jgi:hypothetical protein
MSENGAIIWNDRKISGAEADFMCSDADVIPEIKLKRTAETRDTVIMLQGEFHTA